ncbi:hypothetical protein FM103_06545 [Corynebacterium xerosis]|nr:hypothetical protein FM103_06545 [Corynebacterium xerosis]
MREVGAEVSPDDGPEHGGSLVRGQAGVRQCSHRDRRQEQR